MNDFLDIAWAKIIAGLDAIVAMMNHVLAPLNHRLGPAMVIFLLVVVLVSVSKLLAKGYTTKRYVALKKNYEHWFELRREALACEDREKGKALAKNIDQAQLNKAYYDYFFEGFLKSIITSILPILLVAAYVNITYAPENLIQHFGREYIFKFSRSGSDPIVISAFFWFVISLFLVHLAWFAAGVIIKRGIRKKKTISNLVGSIILLVLVSAGPALATQGHGGIEGVWVHQFGHVFFLSSMILLIYWLRQAGLVKVPGWRYIQYTAIFFILWNLDAMLVHFLDEQILAVEVKKLGGWQIRIDAAGNHGWLAAIYYMLKLDHLFCVPAMACLWLGLRHMIKDVRPAVDREVSRR
ncbi:MAG: hypothetical protein HGJ94_12140 [Desulfosarcina sp.]|nr:hypothetical protein [Desulfosarcina sp.]MBC2744132.1 hypothetical protein [Desulfosarcina sp.]MBC2767041.1 hypothetical protein [Desulfosarcina sp.]